MGVRWIKSNIGKIQIQGHKYPLLAAADFDQPFIGTADNVLGKYGMAIVAASAKHGIGVAWNVFIELETLGHANFRLALVTRVREQGLPRRQSPPECARA